MSTVRSHTPASSAPERGKTPAMTDRCDEELDPPPPDAGCSRPSTPRQGSRARRARHGCGVTPARILSGEPDHQVTDDGRCPRMPPDWFGLRWVGPLPFNQPPMPAQQCLRSDDPRSHHLARERSGKRRQHHPVLRFKLRTSHLPTKHRDLVPQHHQIDVLGRFAAATGHDESEQHPEDRVHNRDQHPDDHGVTQQTRQVKVPAPQVAPIRSSRSETPRQPAAIHTARLLVLDDMGTALPDAAAAMLTR